MSLKDTIKASILKGFSAGDMPTTQILVILGVTFLIGVYIYFIYRLFNRTNLYDRNYHIAMSMISVITAGIIVAMQSSIVISLGMVGALSIVRFRTAVKDTMDLLFLFWSIGEGIICGAGLFEVAIIVALTVTVGIFVLEYFPLSRRPYLLIVNSNSTTAEDNITETIKNHSISYKIKSRSIKKTGLDIIYEVYTKEEKELLSKLSEADDIINASLLSHEGDVRF